MRIAVVILNWNTAFYLERFVPGLLESLPQDAALVVADSGSTDGSLELLAERFPSVRTIPLGGNFGFTGGYDRAIGTLLSELDAPEYVVLINSDIDVPGGWLCPLIEYMDSHPECAACGPKLHALRQGTERGEWVRSERFEYAGAAGGKLTVHGYPYCRGRFLFWTARDRGQFDRGPAAVKWVTGACLCVRSSVWNEIGGLDDRFFAHMEEIDWCWRARRSGYSVVVVPSSTVYHIGGGTLPQNSPFKLKLNFRNSLLMLSKNLPSEIGRRRARIRIRTRIILDNLIMFAYLITARWPEARAVRDAHAEYRKLIDK